YPSDAAFTDDVSLVGNQGAPLPRSSVQRGATEFIRSAQQVLDCGLQLFGIVGPVTIDFQAIGSHGAAVGGASPVTHATSSSPTNERTTSTPKSIGMISGVS